MKTVHLLIVSLVLFCFSVQGKTIADERIMVLNETNVNYFVRHVASNESMFIKL